MKIAYLLFAIMLLGNLPQAIAGKGTLCIKKIYSFSRAVHSRGAYPSEEVRNDGKAATPKIKYPSYEYFIYVETNCYDKIKFSSLTIDGRSYTIEQKVTGSPVMVPGSSDTQLIKRTDNNIIRLIPYATNSKNPPSKINHTVVVKGTLKGKPFVLTNTAQRLSPLVAQ